MRQVIQDILTSPKPKHSDNIINLAEAKLKNKAGAATNLLPF
jgi:hypothetical protein